jgi:hypothetical protein
MPRSSRHTMRASFEMPDESEVTVFVTYRYWPGMAGTYYDPPEEPDADWLEVVVEEGKACRTLTDDEQEAFEKWWLPTGRDRACEEVD